MAKKVKFDFTPSEYQEKIFDWVQHGNGNALIQARSGSGKTTTAVASMKLIPKTEKCLFIAFNKTIADELNNRLKTRPNCTARTTHSLGYLMIKRNFGPDVELDEYKYRNYVKTNITELTTTRGEIKTRQQIEEYIDNITSLIDYARFNLAQSEREIDRIAQKYNIPVSFDECVVTQKCLEWGKENVETVDYTDMIWLPVELSLKPTGLTYDWVYIDEAQDFMPLQHRIIRSLYPKANFTILTDSAQAIVPAINSTDTAEIAEIYSAQTMTLNKSYRSTKEISEFSRGLLGEADYETFDRSGEPPEIVELKSGNEYDYIKDFVKKSEGTTCIITKTTAFAREVYNALISDVKLKLYDDKSKTFSSRAAVLPLCYSKGLEFDNVVVLSSDDNSFFGEENKRLLYMAATRALHALKILKITE